MASGKPLGKRTEKYGREKATRLGTNHIAPRMTVALNPREGVKWEEAEFASGVLVRSGPRVFIATAGHYLDDVRTEEMTVIFPFKSAKHVGSSAEAAAAARSIPDLDKTLRGCPNVAPKKIIRGSDIEDIALLEIDPKLVPDDVDIYDLQAHGSTRPTANDRGLLLTGYAVESSLVRIGPNGIKTFYRVESLKSVSIAEVDDPQKWVYQGKRAFYPSIHIGLTYDAKLNGESLHPRGFSGCGVWKYGDRKTAGGILVPAPILMGIENAYNEDRQCLKVTRVERLISLI